jgi:hypothetical protein
VLTAERHALETAMQRALDAHPDDPVTLLDLGYGTGRVINSFGAWEIYYDAAPARINRNCPNYPLPHRLRHRNVRLARSNLMNRDRVSPASSHIGVTQQTP